MERNRNVSVPVDTTNVVVSESKNIDVNYRTFFSLINTSTGGQSISVTFTDESGAGTGIVMAPGGHYSESISSAADYPTNERICAISSLAGGTLAVCERVKGGSLPLSAR